MNENWKSSKMRSTLFGYVNSLQADGASLQIVCVRVFFKRMRKCALICGIAQCQSLKNENNQADSCSRYENAISNENV